MIEWGNAADNFGDAVRAYHLRRGTASSTALKTTIQINGVLVPRRAALLIDLLRELSDVRSLEGLRILEAGSGFGALAWYLANEMRGAEVVGIDTNHELVRLAREAAGAANPGSERTTFLNMDMTSLPTSWNASFDLVVANNSLLYLPSRVRQRKALAAFFRVLKNDGVAILYQANRWQYREPFTRSPLIHLLPPTVRPTISKLTGWRHDDSRVLLTSHRQLERAMRGAGFSSTAAGTLNGGRPTRQRFGRYIVVAGRKADHRVR